KFAQDKRVPSVEAQKLLAQLKQPGVIYSYRRTDPLPTSGEKESFNTIFPPENTPGGPFSAFSMGGKLYDWKEVSTTDPKGILTMEVPANHDVYLTCVYDAASSGTAQLSVGSDDGIQVWLNGKKIHGNDIDRGCLPDKDRITVSLERGPNVRLFKVNNHGGPCGMEARLRSKVAEFQPKEIVGFVQKLSSNPARGKELFTSLGCVKCH